MDLKATACPRLPVNRENFQTKMILNGALGWLSLLDHLSELGPVGYEVALSLVSMIKS